MSSMDSIVEAEPSTYSFVNSDTQIDSSNRGFKLLHKLGWKGVGVGLGKHEQGITEPVRLQEAVSTLGIGKQSEYDKVSSEATKERKKVVLLNP